MPKDTNNHPGSTLHVSRTNFLDQPGQTLDRDALRRRIIGLGEGSIHKSYYPQLQQRLQELHRFKTLLDGSSEGIFLVCLPGAGQGRVRVQDAANANAVEPIGVLVDVNESACIQLGYTCQEILELSFLDLFPVSEHPRLALALASLEQKEQEAAFITEFVRSCGETFPVEVTLRLVRFDLKPYAVVVARDITKRLRMEAELQRAENLEALGVLAGGIAHDFNNFLTAIMNQLSLARMQVDQPDQVLEKMTFAENACLQAKGLTQQLLTFARGGEPVRKLISIGSLVGDALRLVLAGTNVKPILTIPDKLWLVDVDPGQISQVLNNLLINAVQAMPDGGMLRVRVNNRSLQPEEVAQSLSGEPAIQGDHLCVSIQDSGPGIPEEIMARIFDPYFTTKSHGSGLGLATSHSIIRKHGGTLSVHSTAGQGATFTFCLPARRSRSSSLHSSCSELIAEARPGYRVLFMDDDPMIRESMGEILQDLGYSVTLVRDGQEAQDALHRALKDDRVFDVAILDLTIPGGMGGVEAVQRLKSVDPLLKAVVSSGYSTAPAMARHREYGFDAVVAKPYTVRELRCVLDQVLSESREAKEREP